MHRDDARGACPCDLNTSRISRRRLLAIASAGAASPFLNRLGRMTPTVTAMTAGASSGTAPEFANHVGWAYTIDWMITPDEIRSDMRRMRHEGCTSVYIGHDNPASPGWGSAEPGLSFAVWYEIERSGPRAYESRAKLDLIHTALQAADDAGLRVVLPIDYQMQMGHAWSADHPAELALGPDGGTLRSSHDPIASPYSHVMRDHKRAYYAWIRDDLLSRYGHILAINLGDEPLGCDYSSHAMSEFYRRYGTPWERAPLWEQGEFQSGVVADYAIWCAWEWVATQAGLPAMFTFHIDRHRPFYPNFDRIFHQSPQSFIISADTHLHDAPAWVPFTAQSRNLLFDLCRRLGLWSHVSGRDVMLWHSVNHWGLHAGGIQEALDNHDIVLRATREAGGRVAKTMAWARNIRFQGLYRHEGTFAHVEPDEMVAAITPAMTAAQPSLSTRTEPEPHHVLYAPSRLIYARIGEDQPSFEWDHGAWLEHGNVDFGSTRVVTMTDGPALEAARQRGWTITSIGVADDQNTALPRLYYLPADCREIHAGRIWFGASTHAALLSVKRAADQIRALGLDWLREAGLYKGSLYIAGPDGNYYERVIFERIVMHAVADRFESTLALRDMANGRIELGEGNRLYAELPPPAIDRIATAAIIGDDGSLAPALPVLRSHLTLFGDNQDEDRTDQQVTASIGADGSLGVAPASVSNDVTFVLYDNGHNIPNVLLAEISRRYGSASEDWWPRIGRPIGRAFWMQSAIGNEGQQWVLSQPFERAMLTYHPAYAHAPEWMVQGALVGNVFLRAIVGSTEPYRTEYHDMRW